VIQRSASRRLKKQKGSSPWIQWDKPFCQYYQQQPCTSCRKYQYDSLLRIYLCNIQYNYDALYPWRKIAGDNYIDYTISIVTDWRFIAPTHIIFFGVIESMQLFIGFTIISVGFFSLVYLKNTTAWRRLMFAYWLIVFLHLKSQWNCFMLFIPRKYNSIFSLKLESKEKFYSLHESNRYLRV
jgi:hypothetical protein